MLDAGLVCSRLLHDGALIILFGSSLFPLYAFSSRASDSAARLDHQLQWTLTAATLVALLSGVSLFLFTTADMTDTSLDALDWTALWSVLGETAFGQIWFARLVLIAAIVGFVGFRKLPTRDHLLLLPTLSAAALASLAGVGHTQVNEGIARAVQIGADSAHLLAAGAWLGGLVPLAIILATVRRTPSQRSNLDIGKVLRRFSGMGITAVAVLVCSGLVNSAFLVGSFANLVQTPYGQLLLVKLGLFGGMLALAALNRYWLMPSLMREKTSGQPATALARLRLHVIGEQILGLPIVLIVSALGTMEPAVA